MAKRHTLIVLFVLGTLVAACRTTGAPADEDVIPVLNGTAFYDDLPGEEQAKDEPYSPSPCTADTGCHQAP